MRANPWMKSATAVLPARINQLAVRRRAATGLVRSVRMDSDPQRIVRRL